MNEPDRMEPGSSVVARFAVRSRRAQIAFTLGALGIYGLIFFLTYYLMGRAATTLAVLPVAMIGWLLGMRGGLLTALLSVLLNIILLNLVGESGWEVVTRTAGGTLGAIALVVIGGVIGRMSDLGKRAARELGARQQAEDALVKLQQAVETSGEVIFLTDREGVITYVNPEFTRMYGHTAADVVGKTTPRLLKSGVLKPEDYALFWKTILSKQVLKGEIINKTKDGRFVTVEGSANPILDEQENIIGFLAIQHDITERKRMEDALRESEANLNRAQAVANTGSWRLDIRGNLLSWSAETYRMFGVPAGTPLTYESFLTCVHPEDREFVDRSWQAAVQDVPYDIEHRIVVNDQVKWVRERAESEMDANGLVRGGIGTVQDITARKQAEEERARLLQETRQRAEELEALARVSSALRQAQTGKEMLPVLVQKAAQVVGGTVGAIFLVEPASGDLVARGWYKPGTTRVIGEAAGDLRHHLGEGITGHVAATGEIYVTQDLQHDPLSQVLPGEIEFLSTVRSQVSLPLRAQEQIIGVMHVGLSEQHAFTEDEVRLLTAIADMAANALHRAALHEQTERDAVELAVAYDTTLEGWSHALELRDKETEGHTQRVTELTLRLARAMGMSEAELVHVRRGALLHDIGKMGVPDAILLKPGPLTDKEWEIMRQHPTFAQALLAPIAFLRNALDIPYCHHEKWDGSGYPRGLTGEQIPLAARLFAVVDVWDALRSDRPYRPAWAEAQVRAYLTEQRGKHFDPQVVEAFFQMIGENNPAQRGARA